MENIVIATFELRDAAVVERRSDGTWRIADEVQG
jgi:hypothetical protein